jgi:hypothetical protein
MRFAGLLKTEPFELRSTVDTETLRRLGRRNVICGQPLDIKMS